MHPPTSYARLRPAPAPAINFRPLRILLLLLDRYYFTVDKTFVQNGGPLLFREWNVLKELDSTMRMTDQIKPRPARFILNAPCITR